nr:unnamed protein product [Digitaria exilis]
MQTAANRRLGRRSSIARPLRRHRRLTVPAIAIMYLMWVCLHGDLVAAAVPLPRRRLSLVAAGSHVVGSRPVPAGGAGADARFGDDKRRIPSCPDALHNR